MLMKRKIKIAFSDFWSNFNPKENFFLDLLRESFDIELSEKPDLLIFSSFGYEWTKYNCTKVFYTGENVRPNFSHCDYSISFDYEDYDKKNIRFPLYNLYGDIENLTEEKKPEEIYEKKNKFCNIVFSNPKCEARVEFFKLLNKYKKVDSGGGCLNNIGYKVIDKHAFMAQYKFTIAFENSSSPGYTTEKILEPMMVNSVPIYWGNPKIYTDFNCASFVNVHDFDNFNKVVDYIEYLDKNEDAFLKVLKKPWLPDNKITQYSSRQELSRFIEGIVDNHEHSKIKGSFRNLGGRFEEISVSVKSLCRDWGRRRS